MTNHVEYRNGADEMEALRRDWKTRLEKAPEKDAVTLQRRSAAWQDRGWVSTVPTYRQEKDEPPQSDKPLIIKKAA